MTNFPFIFRYNYAQKTRFIEIPEKRYDDTLSQLILLPLSIQSAAVYIFSRSFLFITDDWCHNGPEYNTCCSHTLSYMSYNKIGTGAIIVRRLALSGPQCTMAAFAIESAIVVPIRESYLRQMCVFC